MVKISLKYPFENKKEWLLLGIIFCIIELFNAIAETLVSPEVAGIIKFISLIIAVFVAGYEVNVIHHAIHELEGLLILIGRKV
jgi:membrane protein implicated in regulation of membrane protease activity